MELIYHGHSCFEVRFLNDTLLIDPFITSNPLVKNKNISGFKPDYILITHGHSDHMADAEMIAKNSGAIVISNFEITTWLGERGVSSTHGMNIGGSVTFSFGKVKMVNATHSSSLPDGGYGGNPAGFVISSPEKTFYYAGDTGLSMDMSLIGEEFELDFSILPVGDNFTMGIDDALKAASLVKTDNVVAMHFDTFPSIEIDHEQCLKKAQEKKVNLIIPKIGESLKV